MNSSSGFFFFFFFFFLRVERARKRRTLAAYAARHTRFYLYRPLYQLRTLPHAAARRARRGARLPAACAPCYGQYLVGRGSQADVTIGGGVVIDARLCGVCRAHARAF